MAGNHTLGTIRGSIEIDYDGAGIVRAIKDTEKLKDSGNNIDKMASGVFRAFGMFARGATQVAAGVGTAYNAVTVLAGAAAVLGPVLAAAFAAAPAVVLGFASALIIAKVALAGVGDALAAAGEDSAKFEKAIEKLSPQAKAFARAYRAALPALSEMGDKIQDAFFYDTAGKVTKVVNAIKPLQGYAAGVARRMSLVAQNIALTATNRYNIADLGKILTGVNRFLAAIGKSLGPVVTGFIGLAAQAAGFGGVVGGSLAGALERFSVWLNQIDLKAVFAEAGPILRSIGTFLSNLMIIAGELFGMFNVDGASAMGILGELASQLAAFLQSAEGQAVLQALGEALQAVAGASGQIFLALLQAIAPVIVALAPGIAQLATMIAGFLVPAIQAVTPLLVATAGFLSDNMSWIAPLAGGVLALAAAYKTYQATATAVAAVQRVLTSSIIANSAAWLANTARLVAARVATVAMAVVSGVIKVATAAWTAVQWLLNAAMTANPIGIVIVAIAALVAAIVLLWNKSETFRTIVLAVWAAIKTAAQAVASWFMGTLVPIFKAVFNFIVVYVKTMFAVYKAIFTALVTVAKAVWSAIVAYIRTYIRTVVAIIRGIQAVIGIVRDAFTRAREAVTSRIRDIVNIVKSLPGKAASALGSLGRTLYEKGRSLVQGFINGIGDMIGAVADKARQVVSAVTRFLPGSPAKEGPLSGRGYALYRARRFMSDFARGINDGAELPVRAVVGAITPVSRAMVTPVSTGRSAASTTGTTPGGASGGTRSYNIQIGDKTLARLVVDAVTGNPVPVAKAAGEGSRQNSWYGSGRMAPSGAR
jgi:phage-related protein